MEKLKCPKHYPDEETGLNRSEICYKEKKKFSNDTCNECPRPNRETIKYPKSKVADAPVLNGKRNKSHRS